MGELSLLNSCLGATNMAERNGHIHRIGCEAGEWQVPGGSAAVMFIFTLK